MRLKRLVSVSTAIGLGLLFAAAFWLRVTSLGAIPWHNGDESYEGTELVHMLRGEPFTLFSQSGNLLSPFFLGLQAPFQLFGEPAVWKLRVAAMISGGLAVVAAYFLGRKALGRTTALLAAGLLAPLPAAIFYGRLGHEYSQFTLFGIIALTFALRGRLVGVVLTLLAALIAHPVNLLQCPVVGIVLAVQLARRYWGDIRARRWMVVGTLVSAVLGLAFAYLVSRRPIVLHTLQQRGPLDWGVFAKGLARFFLWDYETHGERLAMHRNLFWAVVASVTAIGLPQLVRHRRWEQVALVTGFAVTLLVFHAVAGSTKLSSEGASRYGVLLIAPGVLAFACLLGSAVSIGAAESEEANSPDAGQPSRGLRPALGRGVVVLLGGAMLSGLLSNWFHVYTGSGRESLWTLRTDTPEPYDVAFRMICRDYLDRGEALRGPCQILGEDFWSAKPLEYYASTHPIVRVERLDSHCFDVWSKMDPHNLDDFRRLFLETSADRLRRGGYFVAHTPDGFALAAKLKATFPAEPIQTWDIRHPSGAILAKVCRLGHPAPAKAAIATGTPAGSRTAVR
jgi:hypothetical protein